MQTALPSPAHSPPTTTPRPHNSDALRAKAQELEAVFLSEMLSYAGLGEGDASFGGGVGEEQFASFLRGEQAKLMVQKGGIGLAETIFQALVKAEERKNAT
jgi:Rod binding domain-containing protein